MNTSTLREELEKIVYDKEHVSIKGKMCRMRKGFSGKI